MPINSFIESFEYNINVICTNLKELGYKFNKSEPITQPSKRLDKIFEDIESHAGKLPLALKLLYSKIGSIDFTGYHPDWNGCEYPDPLVINPLEYILSEVEMWEEAKIEDDEEGPFLFPISPDFYHKADVSGGEPYGIYLPSQKDDPELANERHETTLIKYLNLCIDYGSFSGLDNSPKHTWPLDKIKKGIRI